MSKWKWRLTLSANGLVVGLKMQTKLSRKPFKCRIRSWRPGLYGETTLMVCLWWRGKKKASIGLNVRGNNVTPSKKRSRWQLTDLLIVILFFSRCHRNMQLGVSAIVCYLHACRHQNEAKCRKYLARTIWLMTYDDEKVWYEAAYGFFDLFGCVWFLLVLTRLWC